MKVNELQLDDWVYGIDGNGGKHPRVIAALDIYPTNRTPRIVTYGGYGYQQENLEPIPLTAEILEKNGFDKNESIFRWMTPEGSRFGGDEVVWNEACKILSIRSSKSFLDFGDCEYVHQLQNCLRLCKIEREIKL